jgi:type I restriction enzyme, S subunit
MNYNIWKEFSLLDLCSLHTGKSNKQDSLEVGKYPFYDRSAVTKRSNKYLFDETAIIVPGEGKEFIPRFHKGKYDLHQRVYAIVPNEEVNPKFLYYNILNNKLHFERIAVGSTVKSLRRASFELLKVLLPPIGYQNVIEKTLSSIDDKIELNNKINQKLEELAQTLYKRWFVDFDFPNEKGDPYLSSGGEMVESELGLIPKGWEVFRISDLVDIVNGYSYKGVELKESDQSLATIKNFSRNGGFQVNGFKEFVPLKKINEDKELKEHDILIACTDLTQNAEIIGNAVLVMSKDRYKNIFPSMDLVKIVPKKDVDKYFLYETLNFSRFKSHAVSCTSGTTVLHLNKKAAFNYKIAVPKTNILVQKYSLICNDIYNKISNNLNLSNKLLKIRDTLLPKLMSGEIEVPIEGNA